MLFCPLEKGFLNCKIDDKTTFESNDYRNTVPRFSEENRKANQVVVDLISNIAKTKEATPAQVALAWLLAQKPWIVPIPGTTILHRLEENLVAIDLKLSNDELQQINKATSVIAIQGERYSEGNQKMIDR